MKSRLFTIVFFTFSLSLFYSFGWSQDLIATKKGDSINCYITKIKPDYIHFVMKGTDGKPLTTLIARNLVESYETDYYSESEISYDLIENNQSKSGVLISFDFAYSLRLGKVDSSIPSSFAKQLKNGTAFTAQVGYFYSNTGGFGLLYNRHSTSADFGSLTDKVRITYVAPVFYFQTASDMDKSVFTYGFSLGYLGFSEELKDSSQGFLSLKGSSLGVGIHFYLGGQINDVIRLSAKAAVIAGTLSELEANGQSIQLQDEQKENLSTFTLGASIGFLLK